VLTYSTGPLAAEVEITGPVRAELYVTSTLAHTDFFARLCDVDPQGRSVNVTDGLIRLAGPAPGTRHQAPGTGEPLATAATLQAAEQTVHHGPDHPSAVLLPVVTG
jgi:predicted acyl esterase